MAMCAPTCAPDRRVWRAEGADMAGKRRRATGDGGLTKVTRKRPNGDTYTLWRATVERPVDPETGKRRPWHQYAKDRGAAQRKLREMQATIAAKGDHTTSDPTWQEWVERWSKSSAVADLSPRTLYRYVELARIHVTPTIGRKRLSAIKVSDARDVLAKARENVSGTTAVQIHATMSVILRAAVEDEQITDNVMRRVKRPRKTTKEVQLPDIETAARVVAEAAQHPLAARWLLEMLTGARKGEVLGLERDRINIEDDGTATMRVTWQMQRIHVRHGCDPENPCGKKKAGSCPQAVADLPPGNEARQIRGSLFFTRPKTSTSQRVIPLAHPLPQMLATHIASLPDDAPTLWTDPATGSMLTPERDNKLWGEITKRAGAEGFALHHTRHLAATLMMASGHDRVTVQRIMGHSTAAMTQHYQHADDGMALAAVTDLAAALRVS